MKGQGPQRSRTAKTLSPIQTATMIVCTARNRPVPRNRAIPSANRPTASGPSRRKLPKPRTRLPLGTSSRWRSATAGPLPPVVGQQVVEHVVDGHRADEPPLGVHDRGGHQVVGGEVARDLG